MNAPTVLVHGGVGVDPGSVPEGGTVDVHFTGPGPLYYSVDGAAWEEVTLDEDGRATVTAPLGSFVIVFSNLRMPPEEAAVEVLSTARRR